MHYRKVAHIVSDILVAAATEDNEQGRRALLNASMVTDHRPLDYRLAAMGVDQCRVEILDLGDDNPSEEGGEPRRQLRKRIRRRSALPPERNEWSRSAPPAVHFAASAGSRRPQRSPVDLVESLRGELRKRADIQAHIEQLAEERKRLLLKLEEDALARRRAEHEREEVLAHLYQSHHRERLRLARDLHDHAGQHTVSLRLGLAGLRRHVRSAAGLSLLERLAAQLDSLGADLHRVATELRPTALRDCGLTAAVQALIEDWREAHTCKVTCKVTGTEAGLSEEAGVTLFRLTQEGLTNVIKHAPSAKHVRVTLIFAEDYTSLTIADDGPGFVPGPDLVRDLLDANRFGIVGIRERVALVGGDFQLESAPGAGTRLLARVPRSRAPS